MTRVDFYYNADSKLAIACIIASKALRKKMRVAIYSSEDLVASAIDNLLWHNPVTGFLPHCLENHVLAEETPVVIIQGKSALAYYDVLVNLDKHTPPFFSRFPRLIEIVSAVDQADLHAARERFRFYKNRGYALSHHDMTTHGTGNRSGK